jgi:hypothetical protein
MLAMRLGYYIYDAIAMSYTRSHKASYYQDLWHHLLASGHLA